MEAILEVRDITKVFSQPGRPAFTAVDHVSFRLMPGEILGIVGNPVPANPQLPD